MYRIVHFIRLPVQCRFKIKRPRVQRLLNIRASPSGAIAIIICLRDPRADSRRFSSDQLQSTRARRAAYRGARHASRQCCRHRSEPAVAALSRIAARDARACMRRDARRARPDDRRHRDAAHRRRTEGLRPVRVGRDVLHACIGHHDSDLRQARRPVWTQALPGRRDRALHGGLRAVRQGRQHAAARDRARRAGHRRRHPDRHDLRERRRPVSRRATAPALARVREHSVRRREHHRADTRRSAHATRRLAARVLRERARGRRVAPVRQALSAEPAAGARRRPREARLARRPRHCNDVRRAAVADRIPA